MLKLFKLPKQVSGQLRYAHYEFLALCPSLHCVFGECATIFWFYTYDFDFGLCFHSEFILMILILVLVCVFIQNVKSAMMRAQPCHWSIHRYARGRVYSFCFVFSSSFAATRSGIVCVRVSATCRKLQLQVERHSQHASRSGPRETRGQETVANIVGLHVRPLWWRLWVADRHGLSSPTPQFGWDTVCRSHELQVHVIYRTSWSIRGDSSPTWYPRCDVHSVICFAENTHLPYWE